MRRAQNRGDRRSGILKTGIEVDRKAKPAICVYSKGYRP
jgi:hypothetical protein